jgi:hypothetical protein
MDIAHARALRAVQVENRARQIAEFVTTTPTPPPPIRGGLSISEVAPPHPDPAIAAQALARLAAERRRIAASRIAYVRPPQGVTWRATPTRFENDVFAADPGGNVGRLIAWDLSPVDQSSFDPPQPPDLVAPPVCNVLPTILGETAVGVQLAGTTGTWVGSGITYARQWNSNGVAIAGQTGITYTPVTGDVGAMLTFTVTASNSGGSVPATSAPVGPIVPAAPRGKAGRLPK